MLKTEKEIKKKLSIKKQEEAQPKLFYEFMNLLSMEDLSGRTNLVLNFYIFLSLPCTVCRKLS